MQAKKHLTIIPLELPLNEEEMGEQDELNRTLKEILYSIKDLRTESEKKNGNSARNIIAAVVGIIGIVLIIAAYIASISGDKRALEIRVDTLVTENNKMWALQENQRLRIEQLEKKIDVQNAVDAIKKGR